MKSALTPKRLIVLIPCFNCKEFIGPCLESLQAQTFTDWTAYVADDCSQDSTRDVVKSFDDPRVVSSFGEDRCYLMGNIVSNLRTINPAPSDVVAVLDGDDLLKPESLAEIWAAHTQGYDLVWTDEDILGAEGHSIGGPLHPNLPIRQQSWCFSHVRSFKGYLFNLMKDDDFRDASGEYFRAAGDLSMYLPMAELAGVGKTRFIDKKLYTYRVHDNCNFKVKRQEQLDNNWYIRSQPAYSPQTTHFDYTLELTDPKKSEIQAMARELEAKYPAPYSICMLHKISSGEHDSWRAYHNLWVAGRVFFKGEIV